MSRMTPRRWWILAALYMAGLFALSCVPEDRTHPGIGAYFPPPDVQNALHIPAYAGLSFLLWKALRGRRHAALLAASLATIYGALDEVHQMFTYGRTSSVTDALANALGAFAVALCVWIFARAPGAPNPPR
jgi:VanZ family protein